VTFEFQRLLPLRIRRANYGPSRRPHRLEPPRVSGRVVSLNPTFSPVSPPVTSFYTATLRRTAPWPRPTPASPRRPRDRVRRPVPPGNRTGGNDRPCWTSLLGGPPLTQRALSTSRRTIVATFNGCHRHARRPETSGNAPTSPSSSPTVGALLQGGRITSASTPITARATSSTRTTIPSAILAPT